MSAGHVRRSWLIPGWLLVWCAAGLCGTASLAFAQRSGTFDGREALPGYPEVTLLIEVKDAQRVVNLVKRAGGTIVYDPNLGIGHDIPFLVITLPGDKVVDESFLRSLDLRSSSIRSTAPETDCDCGEEAELDQPALNFESLFVPVEDLKLPELQQRVPGEGRGKGVRVAVIDTGVDASHPVFQDRVVYWADATREGRISLEKLKVYDGKVTFQEKQLTVPKRIAENKEVFVGVFDETAMGVQFPDSVKTSERQGLDFNRNSSTKDRFLVMFGVDGEPPAPPPQPESAPVTAQQPENSPHGSDDDFTKKPPMIAFIDIDGDGQISGKEAESPILDFNVARQRKRRGLFQPYAEMVVFPSRTRTIAYPLLFPTTSGNNVSHATLCAAFESHGTHVAGIIAGNGEQIIGAAPDAEIMAIKACSGISCTEAAIIRGILEAFFNPQGYVPDVVNISLGSAERYSKDRMDVLIQDLCAKFGTSFFVSAANSGSGYRSINHIGSLSPAVLVGAHVSRATLARHYRLQEGVDVPIHGLMHFSSVGPSYTGQLRPNIVAPGSALSATSLIDGGASMYNGTSMSAPIAAGASAALISLARLDPEYARLERWRSVKIDAVRNKSPDVRYSLTTIPLAMRTALEETAEPLVGFTLAQQGYGLVNIDAAYEKMLDYARQINAGLRLAELTINDNAEARRLYDRNINIPRVKPVELALDADGELDEATRLRLQNTAVEVRLVRVQVQDVDGSVVDVLEPEAGELLPFSIAVPGREGVQGRSIVLGLSNLMKSAFSSVRRLEMMETGRTYVAQYDVFQNQQRLLTLLDIVHKPIELSDLESVINLPGISVDKTQRVACHTVANQPIEALTFHRYPIAVTDRDSALNVQLGFGRDGAGLLMVKVYDPDGYIRGSRVIRKSPQLSTEERTTQLVVPTIGSTGIWEVTVSSFSGQWIGPSNYDLLVEAFRFVPSVEKLVLATKTAPVGSPSGERIVTLMNSSRQIRSLSLSMTGVERIAPMQPFGIAPTFRTFKKVPIPRVDPAQPAARTATVVLELDSLSEINRRVGGRIDHQLYKKGADGKFVPAIKADRITSSSSRKTFQNVPRPGTDGSGDDYYAAMEVFNVYPEGASLSQAIDHVDMLAVFPDIGLRLQDSLRADLLSSDSTTEVKVLRIQAPTEVTDETTPAKSRSSNATLKVETGDPALPEIAINLPVTLTNKPRPATGRAVERARATLRITTDNPNVSVSIPIRVAQ